MTVMLLPEIAMSSVRPLGRVAEDEVSLFSPSGLCEFASVVQLASSTTRVFWDELKYRLYTDGMSGALVRKSTKLFAECLEMELRILDKIIERAADLGSEAKEAANISHRLAARIKVHLLDIEAVQKIAERPLPEGFLERAEKAIATSKGVYISHEDAVASFKDE
jgi:hypothetical protein